MKKWGETGKEAIFSTLRTKAEKLLASESAEQQVRTGNEVELLLHELEIYELELQMQNEELKASHNSLEIERSKFAGLFHSAPVGYLILNPNGLIKEINQTGATLLNAHPSELHDKNLATFIVSDSQRDYYAFIKRTQISPNGAQCELRLKTENAKTKFIQFNATTVTNPITEEKAHYITITDITSAKKIQQRLTETSERLNQTLRASQTGTWMVNPDKKEIFLDEYSKNILDLRTGAAVTTNLLSARIMEEDRPKLAYLFADCKTGCEIDLELRLVPIKREIKTVLVKGKIVERYDGSKYFAGIITDITERKRHLELANEHEKTQQRLLYKASIEAQEREREKIGSALHDSVCQILYGIRFNINHISKKGALKTEFNNINNLLDQAIGELRTLSVELTPAILKDFGFTTGLRDMIRRLETVGFKVHSTIDPRADDLPEETQLYIFRIIQELLNNSIKHSGSSAAKVKICTENSAVNILVSDNGRGLSDEVEESCKQGSGLRGIKNRVALLKGKIEILNQNGVTFKIYFPQDNLQA